MLKKILLALFVSMAMASPAFATTYTTCLRLSLPVPGDPSVSNIWGTLLNTNFTLLDTASGGTGSISVAGGANVALTANQGSADQSRNANFVFSGALTGNIYVLFPAAGCGSFSVKNNTSGAFTLSIGVNNGSLGPAGTYVSVPQGGTLELVSDGTNVRSRVDVLGLGALAAANNLSDLASAATARTNLGLGSLATSSNTSALNAGTNALGARTISTSAPSGTPADGDIWLQY